MRKITRARKRIAVLVVLLLLVAGLGVYAFTKPLPPVTVHTQALTGQPATTVALPWPAYGEAAVGAVGYGVLASQGDQAALPTASIAKVMTALAVLHQKPLNVGEQGPVISITQADVDSYNKYVAEDGSVVKVVVGDQLTEYQALQALLLPSANNIAETLARWAFGSIASYNSYANQYAQAQGLTSVQITDPSGFLPTTIASARDLTLLGITAIQNPVIAGIVSQPTASLPTVGTISNVNALLGRNGTIGIKTGNNDQDKGAYLFAANHTVDGKTITVVGTIMDGPDLGTALFDSLPLISTAGSSFAVTTIVPAGHIVGSYQVPWQGSVKVVAQKDVALTKWKGSRTSATASLRQSLPATTTPGGTNVGTILAQNSLDHTSSSSPAVLAQAIQKPSFLWRLEHVF